MLVGFLLKTKNHRPAYHPQKNCNINKFQSSYTLPFLWRMTLALSMILEIENVDHWSIP